MSAIGGKQTFAGPAEWLDVRGSGGSATLVIAVSAVP
jgi:hypothetical protein